MMSNRLNFAEEEGEEEAILLLTFYIILRKIAPRGNKFSFI